jgi:glucose-6-phosphate isomerase
MQSVFSNVYGTKDFDKNNITKAAEYTKLIKGLRVIGDSTFHETSLFVPADTAYQESIQKSLKPFKSVRHVVLVGIGGSSLGTEAVYHALKSDKTPKLYVVDSIEDGLVEGVVKEVSATALPKDIVVVVVSKSGNTTETVLNATRTLELLTKKYGDEIMKQVIFVGNAGTALMDACALRGATTIPMPEVVGGRYSVLTAVGIVPLSLLGFDIKGLREGALEALTDANLKQIEKRALTLATLATHGVHTVNFFTFTKRLSSMGYWYRQLLAESIGKRVQRGGNAFKYPLNPVVATSADLHSIAELYLGGYEGIYTRFVDTDEAVRGTLPKKHWLAEVVPSIVGKKVAHVKGAIREGVLKAYREGKLPYESITLSKVSSREVGFLLSSLMAEVMYLGYIFEIDPFTQPSVELYKKHTRTALQK